MPSDAIRYEQLTYYALHWTIGYGSQDIDDSAFLVIQLYLSGLEIIGLELLKEAQINLYLAQTPSQ